MQPFDQHVTALAVLLGNVFHALLIAFQGGNGGDLQRCEGAVVVVALDARQRADQFGITHHETNAPACHVVAF